MSTSSAPARDGTAGDPENGGTVPPRVLLVDDDEDYTRFLTRLCHKMGHQGILEVAHNEREAIRALARGHYDLVVSDFELGSSNGVGILRHACEKAPDAYRILLTSAPDNAQRSLPSNETLAHAVWDKRWDTDLICERFRTLLRLPGATGPRRANVPLPSMRGL